MEITNNSTRADALYLYFIKVFIGIELFAILLTSERILTMDYTILGADNQAGLLACVGIQAIFAFLISKYPIGLERTRMLSGQLFFGVVILIWMLSFLNVEFVFKDFSVLTMSFNITI